MKVLLKGFVFKTFVPERPETATSPLTGEGNVGHEDAKVETADAFFNKFIQALGQCELDEARLFSRFAAREAYCNILQGINKETMAARLLDQMKEDIDLMLFNDAERKLSTQYLQWAYLQNTLSEYYTGQNLAPRLEELLPLAEAISDYQMQLKILWRLVEESTFQLGHDSIERTTCLRHLKRYEFILEYKLQDRLRFAESLIQESMLLSVNGLGSGFVDRCTQALLRFHNTHPLPGWYADSQRKRLEEPSGKPVDLDPKDLETSDTPPPRANITHSPKDSGQASRNIERS